MTPNTTTRRVFIAALLLVTLILVYLLLPTGEDGRGVLSQRVGNKRITNTRRVKGTKGGKEGGGSKAADRRAVSNAVGNASNANAALTLANELQYRRILDKAAALGVSVRWIPALRRAILYGRDDVVRRLLSNDEFSELEIEYNTVFRMIPEKETEHLIGPSGRPFLDSALGWLGVDAKDGDRGSGVKIAVLDTAIETSAQSLAKAKITTFDLFGLGENVGDHGTLVTSLIAGDSDSVKGVADGAEILSFPVMDAEGSGSIFHLAEAIVAAADAGAEIISMSVTCPYASPTLKAAVDYAITKGCVIVASAGNEGVAADGTSTVAYPAAYEGVIAVGAVNADGIRAGFSSTGEEVMVAAPGVGIIAEGGEGYDLFSGTSAAAPLAAGAIAYTMNKMELTALKAAALLLETASDAGMPAGDSEYGNGNLNVMHAVNIDNDGYSDSAAADVVLKQNDDGTRSVFFSGQNRGNDNIGEMTLRCTLYFENGESMTEVNVFNDIDSNCTVSLQVGVPDGLKPLYAELSVTPSSNDVNTNNNTLRRSLRVTETSNGE